MMTLDLAPGAVVTRRTQTGMTKSFSQRVKLDNAAEQSLRDAESGDQAAVIRVGQGQEMTKNAGEGAGRTEWADARTPRQEACWQVMAAERRQRSRKQRAVTLRDAGKLIDDNNQQGSRSVVGWGG
jgi:hypothetical protein